MKQANVELQQTIAAKGAAAVNVEEVDESQPHVQMVNIYA